MDSQKRTERHAGLASPTNPHEHAVTIADAVAKAWHGARGAGHPEIPVSVVAALAMITPPDGQHDTIAGDLLRFDTNQLSALIRQNWAIFVDLRPDLVNRAWPLIKPWLGEHPIDDDNRSAAKSVAHAAVRAGQLHLTGTDRRRDTDLFGPLLTILRPDSAISARGQIYTPGALAEMVAHVTGPPAEGDRVLDPAAGTGGLLRAAAQTMRASGRDPTTVHWWAVDIDELAIACLAINAILWNLGPTVVLGVGDALTDDWQARAVAERNELIQLANLAGAIELMRDVLTTPNTS